MIDVPSAIVVAAVREHCCLLMIDVKIRIIVAVLGVGRLVCVRYVVTLNVDVFEEMRTGKFGVADLVVSALAKSVDGLQENEMLDIHGPLLMM